MPHPRVLVAVIQTAFVMTADTGDFGFLVSADPEASREANPESGDEAVCRIGALEIRLSGIPAHPTTVMPDTLRVPPDLTIGGLASRMVFKMITTHDQQGTATPCNPGVWERTIVLPPNIVTTVATPLFVWLGLLNVLNPALIADANKEIFDMIRKVLGYVLQTVPGALGPPIDQAVLWSGVKV